jgi:hypothetical protein
MKSKAVIFDTNIYRGLAEKCKNDDGTFNTENLLDLISKLKERERLLSIQGYANPHVIMELISHLSDTSDKAFEVCKAALCGLVHHCKDDDLRYLDYAEIAVCFILFEKKPLEAINSLNTLVQLAQNISSNPSIENITLLNKNINEIRDYIDKREEEFVDDIKRDVIGNNASPDNPNKIYPKGEKKESSKFRKGIASDNFAEEYAKSQVIKALLEFKKEDIGDINFDELVDKYKKLFPAVIKFFSNLLKKIVDSGVDFTKSKHRNSIWDLQILHFSSKHMLVNGLELLFITNEGAMHRDMADISHCKSLKDYEQLLGK